MNYKEFLVYYRSLIVGAIASTVDISTLYGLSNTNIPENYVLLISSLGGILIQFFGQKYWAFRNNSDDTATLVKQVLKFFVLEISLIFLIIYIFDKIQKKIQTIVNKYPSSITKGTITKYLFKLDNNEVILTPLSNTILKTVLVFILFNLISYPLWKYVIFVK